jgi:hypothetical protein
MANKSLNIPNDLSSLTLKKNVDSVSITVTADCTWCYSDPDNCFPNGLLAPGYYAATNPHTTYGPYTPTNIGTVSDNAVRGNATCSTNDAKETVHSIQVNN